MKKGGPYYILYIESNLEKSHIFICLTIAFSLLVILYYSGSLISLQSSVERSLLGTTWTLRARLKPRASHSGVLLPTSN